MTEQSSKAALYRKIAAVAGAIEAVEKDGRNKDQGYRYATPASVMSAVKPLMAANHLAIIPCQVHFEEVETGRASSGGKAYTINRVSMQYIVVDGESGESVTIPWQAQAGTYGDDKGLAKAQTIALRTFLIQLFQIPAEDPETDPDAAGRAPDRRASYDPPRQQPAKPAAPEISRLQGEAQLTLKTAESRFYNRWSETIGGTDWKAVQRYLMTRAPQPTTVDGWIAIAEAVQGKSKEAPPNGTPQPQTREDWATALKALWEEEKARGGEIPAAEIAIDLDDPEEAPIATIKQLGKKSKARIIELRKQPA